MLADSIVPFWSDAAFKTALVALIVALTGWVGWLMRERKAQREEVPPGGGLPPSARQELETVKSEVKALKDGLADLSDKADDLARGVGNAAEKIQDLDDKVDTAAVKVAELARDMDWVKRYLESIGRKLGI